GEVNPSDRALALSALAGLNKQRADDYDSWLKVGMALHSVDQDEGMLEVWDKWSQTCEEKYQDGECEDKWDTFDNEHEGAVTLGSLIHWAHEDGWQWPTKSAAECFTNFVWGEKPKKGRTPRHGLAAQTIEAELRRLTNGWPRRIGSLLFAEGPGPRPLWLERPAGLFAWIGRQLSPDNRRNGLEWAEGPGLVGRDTFHAPLAQAPEGHDAAQPVPHHPPLPR